MKFHYRIAPFGTRFRPQSRDEAASPEPSGHSSPSALQPNELALDVGGICLGHDGCDLCVVDHHFVRSDGGQFPSAAAAVLHKAETIHQRFAHQPEVGLVTHMLPDFDAFCSMYLARKILEGEIPHEGWEKWGLRDDGWFGGKDGSSEIDWFAPRIKELPTDRRWPVLLAAYSSVIDNCRLLHCRKERALHAVLYAAIVRGRKLDNGALDFFETVRALLESKGLNPLFDSVFENTAEYAPELAFLDRQSLAYGQDLRRARKTVVNVQKGDFRDWFEKVRQRRLLLETGEPNPEHLEIPGEDNEQIDGLYLRDPECLLFKEWARNDLENSPMGQGFEFTAVAYSNGRPAAQVNTSDYYFSLDPERAFQKHLYNVWVRLQAAEVTSLKQRGGGAGNGRVCRKGFEGRAGDQEHLFADPWFDGHNYRATLVATPAAGTVIAPPGSAPDLSDDPVARIVRSTIEDSSIFASEMHWADYSQEPGSPRTGVGDSAPLDRPPPLPERSLRFCRIELGRAVDPLRPGLGGQIGRSLWRWIDPDWNRGVPTDFESRHLLLDAQKVIVWNRHGLAVAFRPAAREDVEQIHLLFEDIWKLVRDFGGLSSFDLPGSLEAMESLMLKFIKIRSRLVESRFRALRRFNEAAGIDKLLDLTLSTYAGALGRRQTHAAAENLAEITNTQKVIHLIEYLVGGVYAAELWHLVAPEASGWHWDMLVASALGVLFVEILNRAVLGYFPMLRLARSLVLRRGPAG